MILLLAIIFLNENAFGDDYRSWQVAYTGAVKPCMVNDDCDLSSGEKCFYLYDGCSMGQCMCEETRRKEEKERYCTSSQRNVNDPCDSGGDSCRPGMTCSGGFCRCMTGNATSDGRFCLQGHNKILGQRCSSYHHSCLQKAVYGYTKNDVVCTSGGLCACVDGFRQDGVTCNRRRVDEFGCYKAHHCEGGAICLDNRCVCPTGYFVPSGYSKCIGRDVVTDLPLGAACDEINSRSYCAQDLVCHRCNRHSEYKCVKFLKSSDFSFLTNISPPAFFLPNDENFRKMILSPLFVVCIIVVVSNFIETIFGSSS